MFLAIVQSAIEGYVSYRYLVSGWGDPLLLVNPNRAFRVLADLQPLFDAIREFLPFLRPEFWLMVTVTISGVIRPTLLRMEDLDVQRGHLRKEGQDGRRCGLRLHHCGMYTFFSAASGRLIYLSTLL